jgi:hypothetical protein
MASAGYRRIRRGVNRMRRWPLNAAHGQGRVDEVDALLRFEPG